MGRGRNWEGIDHSLSCAAVLREILLFHSTTESAEHIDYQQVNSGKTISQTDHSCALLSITALQLARSCSGWKEMQIRKY